MSDEQLPHRRFNPLTAEWVIVSPQRTERPWRGQVEKAQSADLPAYDPQCYLCPGNKRAGGKTNPLYTNTYVFDNDFPALLQLKPSQPPGALNTAPKARPDRLLIAEPEAGVCRVVCFTPMHNLSIPEMSSQQIEEVIRTWIEQSDHLSQQEFIHYIQIFENRGAMMGASNPHPHCQIWATSHIPNEPEKERASQFSYHVQHKSCLLCDYLRIEQELGERVIFENEYFTVLVPYWAIWPFETMVLAKQHIALLRDLSPIEIGALADILRYLTIRYDSIFNTSFPYSMGFHQSPVNSGDHPEWHLHAHYFPPLLRSATVRKFMVGFEMLASPQRDITPERAAQRLRSVGDIDYQTVDLISK